MTQATKEHTVGFLIYAIVALIASIFVAFIAGCETRGTTVVRKPSGEIEVSYRRSTLFSDSRSEGLSLARDGDDVVLEVGPTGSEARIEEMIKLLELAKP